MRQYTVLSVLLSGRVRCWRSGCTGDFSMKEFEAIVETKVD